MTAGLLRGTGRLMCRPTRAIHVLTRAMPRPAPVDRHVPGREPRPERRAKTAAGRGERAAFRAGQAA